MQRLIALAVTLGLLFAGCQALSSNRGRLQLLSGLGVEVPGIDTPLSDLPHQYTADGRHQVVVYGPPNCSPTARTVQTLAQHNIPYIYKNTDIVSQEELGSIILSIPENASGGSPLVLVNEKVLLRPSIHDILAEFTQRQPRT